jgi:hypothetical protein
MKGQVYIDLLVIFVIAVAMLALVTFTAQRVHSAILSQKIEEELDLVLQQIATSISRLSELGERNPIVPEPNETILLGIYNLALPDTISGRSYEVYVISRSPVWANVRNFTANGVTLNYEVQTANPVLVAKVEDPAVKRELVMPNLPIPAQGYFSGGFPYLRYYRYDLDGKVHDVMVLASYLIVHVEVMTVGV